MPVTEVKEVLLTGATGFVGRFVLRDLLSMEGGLVVHCLVRATDGERGLQRLRGALEEADMWDEAFAARIRVVIGDVGEARFGLSRAAFDDLARRIDAVHHFAAEVSLSASYLAIRKANAFSMRNILELCLRTRLKHLFHASTMGVYPQYFCDFANEFADRRIDHQGQPDLGEMKRMFPLSIGGYSWSKLVAEQSVLYAHQAGLPGGGVPIAANQPLHDRIYPAERYLGAGVRRGGGRTDDAGRILVSTPEPCGRHPEPGSVRRLRPTPSGSSPCITAATRIRPCTTWSWPTSVSTCARFLTTRSNAPARRAARTRPCTATGPCSRISRPIGSARAGRWPTCRSVTRALREDCPFAIEWPGILTMFRRTNDWIREHRERWPFSLPQPQIDYDRLITRAKAFAERFGAPFELTYPEWMRSGLAHLVQALQAPEARLLQAKRAVVVSDLSASLRNNAKLTGERLRHPEIEREPIVRPVFIVGINRTGTTFLHRLLARDPRFWTVHSYELAEPVVPDGDYAAAWTDADTRRARLLDVFVAAGFF